MTALTLDHVQIAMPAGREDDARRFFGDLLGLAEIAKPAALAARGACWFALGDRQLHLGVDPHFTPATKAHVALATGDLAALRTRFAKAGHVITEDDPVDGRERCFTVDPFGNRLELIQSAVRA